MAATARTIKQAKHAEAFEQVLLSYVEMCYAVARTLTRNPDDARDLTQEVLIWAWHLRDSADVTMNIKTTLLIELRKRFLHSSLPRDRHDHSLRVVNPQTLSCSH